MNNWTQFEQELREWLETQVGMVCPERGMISKNKHGTPYITFVCGGPKIEGSPVSLLASTPEALIDFAKVGICRYLAAVVIEGPRVLYWRAFPKIESVATISGQEFLNLYCRFVVDRL